MIVDFKKYTITKREKSKMDSKASIKSEMNKTVLEKIKINRIDHHYVYHTSDMPKVVQDILQENEICDTTIVPVVRIAKNMNFSTYQRKLFWFLSGSIEINKKYIKRYNTDHVIFTNKNVNPFQQRFVIAHELAHFLFDYDHQSPIYYNTYIKNNHNEESERRANAFAANLLMPKELFIKEYNKALRIHSDPVYIMFYLSEKFKSPRKAVIKRISEVMCDEQLYRFNI